MSESPVPVPGAPPGSQKSASLLARLRDRDHTRGSLLGSIAVLSLPSIAMSVLGFGLFQLVDLRFLALLGDAEVAAAGAHGWGQDFEAGTPVIADEALELGSVVEHECIDGNALPGNPSDRGEGLGDGMRRDPARPHRP